MARNRDMAYMNQTKYNDIIEKEEVVEKLTDPIVVVKRYHKSEQDNTEDYSGYEEKSEDDAGDAGDESKVSVIDTPSKPKTRKKTIKKS